MIDVSVIYVNWNCADDILKSVESVKETTRLNYEIIVVDNASPEGIRDLERDDIRLIRNQANVGFGAGCNAGARHANGELLLFLNPDTVLIDDVPSCLAAFLKEHPGAGGAGPMVLELDGKIHFGAGRSFPGIVNEFLEHSTLTFKRPQGRLTGRPYYSFWDHDSTRPVDALLGACMMFRRELFEKLGGFDERFFLYYEEVDLCKRSWDAGRPIYYVHTCRLRHVGHQSVIKEYGSLEPAHFHYFESANKYFKKHQGAGYAFLWRIMFTMIYLARYMRRRRHIFLAYAKWGLGIVQHNHTDVQSG